MSAISGIYRFALARKGRVTSGPHSRPPQKMPDSAVLQLRREHEAAPFGLRNPVIRKYAALYAMNMDTVWHIAHYMNRSSPNHPLDPSLEKS